MILVNVAPYFTNWGSHRADGIERVGFPFYFFVQGGMSGLQAFYPAWLAADAVIVVIAAKVFADVTRRGLWDTFRRLRTWGTPDE